MKKKRKIYSLFHTKFTHCTVRSESSQRYHPLHCACDRKICRDHASHYQTTHLMIERSKTSKNNIFVRAYDRGHWTFGAVVSRIFLSAQFEGLFKFKVSAKKFLKSQWGQKISLSYLKVKKIVKWKHLFNKLRAKFKLRRFFFCQIKAHFAFFIKFNPKQPFWIVQSKTVVLDWKYNLSYFT